MKNFLGSLFRETVPGLGEVPITPQGRAAMAGMPPDFASTSAVDSGEGTANAATAPRLALPPILAMNFDSDPAMWPLPDPIRSKFIAIRQAADDARAVVEPLLAEIDEVRQSKMRAHARLQQLRRDFYGLTDEDQSIKECHVRIERANREIERLEAMIAERNARAGRLRMLADRAEKYLRESGVADLLIYNKVSHRAEAEPTLSKGETIVDAIERCRRRSRALRADLAAVAAAPWPSSAVLGRATAEIEKLARDGAPSVHGMIEDPQAGIGWRGRSVTDTIVGNRVVTSFGVPEAWPTFVWLNRDQLITAIEREIKACADDEHALTAKQRADKSATIKRDLIVAEREEEALITRAQQSGTDILRRPDADPRAVLEIGDDAPEPRQDAI